MVRQSIMSTPCSTTLSTDLFARALLRQLSNEHYLLCVLQMPSKVHSHLEAVMTRMVFNTDTSQLACVLVLACAVSKSKFMYRNVAPGYQPWLHLLTRQEVDALHLFLALLSQDSRFASSHGEVTI
jgi:hypothetical protein